MYYGKQGENAFKDAHTQWQHKKIISNGEALGTKKLNEIEWMNK